MDTEYRLLEPAAVNDTSSTRRHAFKKPASILLSLLILIAIGAYIYQRTQPQAAGNGQRGARATTVGIAQVTQQDVPIVLDALGTVTPLATAVVRPQVSGVLTQVMYTEGQLVQRGQVLAQIDPAPFQLALQQAQGNLQRDAAQLELAKVTLTRDQTLLAKESIAQQDVDTQVATVKQLQGVVATDQANVDTAKLNLNYSRITAPIDGRVGLRSVDVGNYVTPADTAGVATVNKLSPIDIEFSIPGDAIARLQARMATKQPMTATVMDRTKTNVLGTGTFLTLDNQVDIQTGTVRSKARFDNSQQTLFPNQFVNVRLLTDTMKNALVVPSAAVRHGPQGDFVYRVDADNTAHVSAVTTGPAAGDQISILNGLAAGDRVVTEGGDRLTDGATVKLPEKRANAGAGDAGDNQGKHKRNGQNSQPPGDNTQHAAGRRHRDAAP